MKSLSILKLIQQSKGIVNRSSQLVAECWSVVLIAEMQTDIRDVSNRITVPGFDKTC